MDRVQELAWNATGISAAVLGNGEKFILIFLDRPLDDNALAEAARGRYRFAGTMAVIDGHCRAACESSPQ